MSRLFKITSILAVAALSLISCDKTKRNLQYMPDMYEAVPGDPYSESKVFANGTEAQAPVKGTIARGHVPYEFPDTEAGYQAAKASLVSPLTEADKDAKKAANLYTIYCSVCHGAKGDGQGALVQNEKFLGIPNYKDREVTEGSIYHVIMYGKNMMGSHASQLTEKERWLVVSHVQKLRNQLLGK